jgi:hypothetical protein
MSRVNCSIHAINFRQRNGAKRFERVSMNSCLCWLIIYARPSKIFYVSAPKFRCSSCVSTQRQCYKFSFGHRVGRNMTARTLPRSKHAAAVAVARTFLVCPKKAQQKSINLDSSTMKVPATKAHNEPWKDPSGEGMNECISSRTLPIA